MRNPGSEPVRPAVRVLRGPTVVTITVVGLLFSGAGTASAVRAEPNAMTFGLLGPVGLGAVILGVLGMVAGVLRQRRKARAQVAPVVMEPEPAAVAAAEMRVASPAGD